MMYKNSFLLKESWSAKESIKPDCLFSVVLSFSREWLPGHGASALFQIAERFFLTMWKDLFICGVVLYFYSTMTNTLPPFFQYSNSPFCICRTPRKRQTREEREKEAWEGEKGRDREIIKREWIKEKGEIREIECPSQGPGRRSGTGPPTRVERW